MKYFEDINEIKTADVEKLAQVPEIPRNVAQDIYSFFHDDMLK
jgi:excinuclease ABC subunit C